VAQLNRVELDVSAVLESKLSPPTSWRSRQRVIAGVPSDRPIDLRVGGTLKFKGPLGVGGRGLGVWSTAAAIPALKEGR
jgi:hypothetical protein